jgi:hypothetical protein
MTPSAPVGNETEAVTSDQGDAPLQWTDLAFAEPLKGEHGRSGFYLKEFGIGSMDDCRSDSFPS